MSCFSGFFNKSSSSSNSNSDSLKSITNPFNDPPNIQQQQQQQPEKQLKEKTISSSKKVSLLRSQLIHYNLDAYIIPTNDSHSSEYVGKIDKRRNWLSNFNGSAGIALITKDGRALMFVDSRYYTQAEKELDLKVWELNKVGLKNVLNWDEWLGTMPKGSKIGLDPYLTSYSSVISLQKTLKPLEITLVFPEKNLIDLIWEDQPLRSHETVEVHGLEFAGESATSKLTSLKSYLTNFSTSESTLINKEESISFLISSLPSIAWLLNLRGKDIEFNPLFYSYVLVKVSSSSRRSSSLSTSELNEKESKVEINDDDGEVILFIQPNVLSKSAEERLRVDGVTIRGYSEIVDVLKEGREKGRKILSGSTISYGLALAMGLDNLQIVRSPIEDSQSIKNPVELQGFRNAYLRDGLAWCKWSAWLEELIIKKKENINEWNAAVELTRFRESGEYFRGLSYENISATNENAALPHYAPSPTNSRIIDTQTPYLNDSGAQYLDGTIDTTRTVHFGKPTHHQRLAFTRVLQGHIAVDRAIFPRGTTGFQLDLLARGNLWREGMDYAHGTGHGVGEYLSVHEGPQGIGSSLVYNSTPLVPGHITSNEPGYYKVNSFGIRLESVIGVKEVETRYNEGDKGWLGFERFTMVPIQTSFTDQKLMSKEEKAWLKAHNKRCVDMISPLLMKGDSRTLKWLKRQ